MTATVHSFPPPVSPWHASRDALDIVGDMREADAEMRKAADILWNYPADSEARAEGRAAARKYITLCDELERLS